MAKGPKFKLNTELLKQVIEATKNNSPMYLTQADAISAGLQMTPPLIEANITMLDPNDSNKAAVRATPAAEAAVAAPAAETSNAGATASPYAIVTGAALPVSKRGGGRGGAPTQYPFDSLEIGQSFFVPVSEKHENPVKTLGSTVSSANLRFSEETGATRKVTRVKRGEKNKGLKDAAGNKIMEDVEVAVRKQLRKFSIRSVEAGKKYGEWTAPADGALIQRVKVD